YRFYEHIDTYLEYERICCDDENCQIYNKKCESIVPEDYDNEDKLLIICSKFHCLIEKLLKLTPSQDEKFHLEYLNYWLNYELNKIYAQTYPVAFYKNVKSKDNKNNILKRLDGKLCDIDENEMKNMNWLFYLYREYFNFIKANVKPDAIKGNFKLYSNPKPDKYKEFEAKCLNVTSCSKALCAFKKKCERIKLKIPELEDSEKNELPSLSKCENTEVNDYSLKKDEQIEMNDENNFHIPTNI
ncbi:hypothetical protein PCYB_008110, partial [Plasmodium cynomolgi strain B]